MREFKDRGAPDNLEGATPSSNFKIVTGSYEKAIFEFQNSYGELRTITKSYKKLRTLMRSYKYL